MPKRKQTVNGWSLIPSLVALEAYAQLGWDAVTIDMQHGWWDYQAAISALVALETAGVKPLVRVPWNEPAILGKMLDAGAQGIICPMINSRSEAESFVKSCLYPPSGSRSMGPIRGRWRTAPRSPDESNADLLLLPQIETLQASRAVDDILSVPGIGGFYVGPGDLGLSMGLSAALDRNEPEILSIYDKLVSAAKTSGKVAAIHCNGAEYAETMLQIGFDFVTVGSDMGHMLAGANKDVNKLLSSQAEATSPKSGNYV